MEIQIMLDGKWTRLCSQGKFSINSHGEFVLQGRQWNPRRIPDGEYPCRGIDNDDNIYSLQSVRADNDKIWFRPLGIAEGHR